MNKILITGANGFIGRYLFRQLSKTNNVIGIDISSSNVPDIVKIDISNVSILNEFIYHGEPDIIIHTGAIKSLEECEGNRSLSWKTNVNSTEVIANYANKHNKKVIYISSDVVFDGETGNYKENDFPCPINWYGATKVASENILRRISNYAICRTALVFGQIDIDYQQLLAEEIKNEVLKNQTLFVHYAISRLSANLPLFTTDEYQCNPTPINVLSKMIEKIITLDSIGIFHTAGSDQISRKEFVYKIANKFGLDSSLIKINDSKISSIRPKNITLNTESTYTQLGISKEEGSIDYALSNIPFIHNNV